MDLVRAKTVDVRGFLRLFRRTHSAEEGRGRALAVAVVVDQGVFGGKAFFGFIEIFDLPRSHEKRFERGNLAVLIEVGGKVRDGFADESAEAGEVLFVPAAG